MPKVALRPIDKFEDRLRQNLQTAKGTSSNDEFGRKFGVCRQTVSNRLEQPLDLTMREFFKICESGHIDLGKFVTQNLKDSWR